MLVRIRVSNFIGKSLNLPPPYSTGARTPLSGLFFFTVDFSLKVVEFLLHPGLRLLFH